VDLVAGCQGGGERMHLLQVDEELDVVANAVLLVDDAEAKPRVASARDKYAVTV
jgi:hypothetical protein